MKPSHRSRRDVRAADLLNTSAFRNRASPTSRRSKNTQMDQLHAPTSQWPTTYPVEEHGEMLSLPEYWRSEKDVRICANYSTPLCACDSTVREDSVIFQSPQSSHPSLSQVAEKGTMLVCEGRQAKLPIGWAMQGNVQLKYTHSTSLRQLLLESNQKNNGLLPHFVQSCVFDRERPGLRKRADALIEFFLQNCVVKLTSLCGAAFLQLQCVHIRKRSYHSNNGKALKLQRRRSTQGCEFLNTVL